MSRWFNAKFQGQAPRAQVKAGRSARYRMPRRLKQELIERFCTVAEPSDAVMPSVMIVVAHQDDESIGAGSRLCRVTEALVVHVTDGAPRDPAVAHRYGFSTREEYADARKRELLAAMNIAGVPHDRLVCLDYVDGEAAFRMVDLVLDVAQLIDDFAPDILVTHPYEGGHTDHDATAFAVHLACGLLRREGVQPPAVLEFTSYHNRDGERVVHEFLPHARADKGQRLILLADDEQQRKAQMYECFTSQQNVVGTFSTAIEKFRPAPRYNFTEAPHAGLLNYERYGDPNRGERWRKNAHEALGKLRLRKS
jgi:LmbE family N-acetylglucosaminyl deacetylase